MFRLIDASQVCDAYKIELRTFLYEEPTPPYVIFSHAPGWLDELSNQWSNGSHDLSFREMHEFKNPWDESLNSTKQRAYQKVFRACECALRLGHRFIWINTVCVDEFDSGEMNRSAGAMFKWHSNAEACLVYLPDSYGHRDDALYTRQEEPCTWWTQCWTFTALLASKQLYLYDGNGGLIIHYVKQPNYPWGPIQQNIWEITEMNPDALFGTTPLSSFSFKAKMAWCRVQTDYKRQEDLVYCLIGAFDVEMDGNYGEGSDVAYHRFQSKVISSTHDLSILAWNDEDYPEGEACRALAGSRDQFSAHGVHNDIVFRQPLRITDQGIMIRHRLHIILTHGKYYRYFLILGPGWLDNKVAGIFLEHVEEMVFRRIGGKISIFDGTIPVQVGGTWDITIRAW